MLLLFYFLYCATTFYISCIVLILFYVLCIFIFRVLCYLRFMFFAFCYPSFMFCVLCSHFSYSMYIATSVLLFVYCFTTVLCFVQWKHFLYSVYWANSVLWSHIVLPLFMFCLLCYLCLCFAYCATSVYILPIVVFLFYDLCILLVLFCVLCNTTLISLNTMKRLVVYLAQ